MESESFSLTNRPRELKKSVDTISILVVDDDTTCLSFVAAILKKFKYEVVTVKHANDALCTLRIKSGAFDLVVSDVHMPDMNGFELQQAIAQEFNNLPVVLMSGDEKEDVALKGLEGGAAFFICKPICADDVRDLWQFAAMKKKSQVVIEEETKDDDSNEITTISISSSSDNEDNRDSKKKSSGREKGENSAQKKPKIIWTNSLHNRFLEAIRSIGLDRAVPKKILEEMDIPGLTRENVASHLQKYRIFLRRVSDASYKVQYSIDHTRDLYRASIEPSPSSITPSNLLLNKFPGQLNNFPITWPMPEANSSAAQPGLFSQSRFVNSNQGNPAGLTLNIGNTTTNPIYHPNNNTNFFPGNFPNITLEDISLSPAHLPVVPNNPGYQTNYVGYSISNLDRVSETAHIEEVFNQGWLDNYGLGITEPPPPPIYDNNISNYDNNNNYDNINLGGGEQLSNVIADYGRVMNLPSHSNGGGIFNGSGFSPMFDFSEFDAMSGQQPLDEVDFNSNLGNQVSFLNQAQQNGGDNFPTSSFFGGTSNWQNCVPSFDQAVPSFDQANQNQQQYFSQDLVRYQELGTSSQLNNTTIVSPTNQQVCGGLTNTQGYGTPAQLLNKSLVFPLEQRDDDDFLESLLAPYGEDQTLEGIGLF